MDQRKLRNFSIIAHIDHGKSTLADKLILATSALSKREMKNQVLDIMDLERERGITIKAQTVCLKYLSKEGGAFIFNMIDTPGHVDFTYEVSRSLAACDGVLLVIDATQGIQAQTISNLYLALEQGLEIIPILNKIDLPGSMIEEVSDQIIDLLDCDQSEILHVSAKDGIGIDKIIDQIIKKIPEPKGNVKDNLQAMVFDSVFNSYRGVEVIFRIFNGTIKKGDTVKTPKLSFTRLAGDINLVLAGNKHQLKAEGNDFHRMITFKANGQKVESIEELTTMINDILG